MSSTITGTRRLPRPTAIRRGVRRPRALPSVDVRRLGRRFAPVRRRMGPVLGLVQSIGWGVVLLTGVCLVVGRRTGWDELLVIAAAGLVLLATCAVFLLGRTSVEVELRLSPQRLTVGDPPVTGDVSVTNTAARPLLPIEVELPVGRRAHRFRLPLLGPRSEHVETFLVPAQRRCVIPVGPVRTRRGDPLGLFRRDLTWTGLTEVFVRPRALPLESLGAGLLRDLEGVTSSDISPSDLAFHALREYVPGDDLRHVHWLSSAKSTGLMVRQYLDTRRSHVTLVVDHHRSSYRDGEDFETAMSIAATIARRSFIDEFDVSFVCDGQEVTGGDATQVLDAMCRVELGDRDLVSAMLGASRVARDTSLLFVVSGSELPFRDVQRASVAFGPEVRRYAIRVAPGSGAAVSEAGGLPVLTVPALESLPAVLRWSVR